MIFQEFVKIFFENIILSKLYASLFSGIFSKTRMLFSNEGMFFLQARALS
jgi:hypothetical protein